ncbi:MAG: pentapeptide repeat-containing protein [Hafnia sp.]
MPGYPIPVTKTPQNTIMELQSASDAISAPEDGRLTILKLPINNRHTIDEINDIQKQKQECLVSLLRDRPIGNTFDLRDTYLRNLNFNGLDLSFVDLSGANLSNTNLSGCEGMNDANLSGAILTRTNFNGVDLSNANLTDANLSNANLGNTNLSNANLSNANLSNAILVESDLTGTNFNGVDFSGANLRRAILCNADLSQCLDLSDSTLNEASLSNSVLTNVDLSGVDLSNADLSGADLRGANLSDTKLNSATLNHSNLTGAKLGDTQLPPSNLKGTIFNGVRLNEYNLQNVAANQINMSGARLSATTVTRMFFNTTHDKFPDLGGVHLEKAEEIPLTLKAGCWDFENIDRCLNHIDNGTSLLTAIDSIDNKYDSTKIKLALQLLKSLEGVNTSPITEALVDILLAKPYTENPEIKKLLMPIINDYLGKYDSAVMPPLREKPFNELVRFFSEDEKNNNSVDISTHNGAFTQLIAHGVDSKDPSIKQAAIQLYDSYLKSEKNAVYTRLDGLFGDLSGNPDWADDSAANYILWSSQNNGRAMIVSHNELKNSLNTETARKPPDFYLFENGSDVDNNDFTLNALFGNDFKIFRPAYDQYSNQPELKSLLSSFEFDSDLKGKFISAITESRLGLSESNKLISMDDQLNLLNIFRRKLSSSATSKNVKLSREHYDEIVSCLNLNGSNDKQKSVALWDLATVFIRYASSSFFGTEGSSPSALREYAAALMIEADALDASVVPGAIFNHWKNRLFGIGGAFACAERLSKDMFEYMSNKNSDRVKNIIPPAWM